MLSILLLDTLQINTVNATDCLKAAYTQRELPIKRLVVYDDLDALCREPIEQFSHFSVFVASFSKPEKDYIEFAKQLRRQRERVFVLFVVDSKVDVTTCVRPSVRPAGILFIPLEKKRIYQAINEIYSEYMKLMERRDQQRFTIKSGGEYFTVNTGEILFFEAQGKKIAIKTRGQEILFYSNFDTILKQLPDCFVRCHKGYVVNTKMIAQASFTEMTLTLRDQSVIPISRTYRDEIRLLLEAKGGQGL
jgi:DNA-binding LytR/AlgR family response regulator